MPKPPRILYHLSLDASRARSGFYGEVYISQFSIFTPDFLLLCILRHLVLLDYVDCSMAWNLVMLSRPQMKWKTPSGQDVKCFPCAFVSTQRKLGYSSSQDDFMSQREETKQGHREPGNYWSSYLAGLNWRHPFPFKLSNKAGISCVSICWDMYPLGETLSQLC